MGVRSKHMETTKNIISTAKDIKKKKRRGKKSVDLKREIIMISCIGIGACCFCVIVLGFVWIHFSREKVDLLNKQTMAGKMDSNNVENFRYIEKEPTKDDEE